MRKLAIVLGVLFSSSAFAQSSGIPWTNGRVLTAPMMQQFDAAKMNLNSLGKPGFAAKLDAQGRIDAPVVGDVSQARATTDGKTVSQIGQMADGSVQQTEKNQPNGVAGLDILNNVTAKIATPLLTAAPLVNGTYLPLINSGRFPVYKSLVEANKGDPFQSPDAVYIGNLPTLGWSDSGLANNSEVRPGSLVIAGQPWGPYNAATLESLLMGSSIDMQNGVCASDWRQGASMTCGADGVAQYIGVTGPEARIVSNVSGFTATSVTLSTPLSDLDISKLRVGMYIASNYINSNAPTQSANPWGDLKQRTQNYYQGVISGWSDDGKTIYVNAWSIPAWNRAENQVPGQMSGDVLDTYFTNYPNAVVLIGMSSNASAHNEYIDYKGYKSGDDSTGATQTVTNGTSLVHAMSADEIDLRYWATRENEVHLDGITISVAGDPGNPIGRKGLTPDSSMLTLSGDIHNLINLDGPSDGNIINGHSFYLHGQEGTWFTKGSDPSGSGIRQVTTNFYFTSTADSTDYMNLVGYQQAYGIGVGASNTSYHFGMHVDGNPKTPTDFTNGGSNWGEIEWNPKGSWIGSIALCAQNENCGVIVDGNGNTHLPNGANIREDGLGTNYGLNIGSVVSGHVAGIGLYTPSGYNHTLFEIMNGTTQTLSVDPSGNFMVANQITSGANITLGVGASLIGIPSSTSGYATLRADSATSWTMGTSAGGYASLSVNNLTSNGDVSSHTMHIPYGTPASSTDTCTQGQIEMDADYIYSCVATNSWHRISNGASW
ncbi:hypothetical protein K6W37_10150 [Acetobacter senegalensis]|uniref:hypothetical protein n=1 Tax=Acetobacter senegalensis TaxID=446692 RepID=UPI001EDACABC|nr:hypothetical protein [Acetobacter senegalensis]MCG4254247.1 hypothetical protein [Acetobacter senegalensis]